MQQTYQVKSSQNEVRPQNLEEEACGWMTLTKEDSIT